MSIFGTSHPKIIVNIDTTLDEVLLQHAVVLKDEPELDTYAVRAVRTGKRVFTNAGKHWLFQVKIYLYKYADAEAKYLEFKGYEGTKVYLYRHADGNKIKTTDGVDVPFVIISINESYTDEHNKHDVLIITFRSTTYVAIQRIFKRTEGLVAEVYYEEVTTTEPSTGTGLTANVEYEQV